VLGGERYEVEYQVAFNDALGYPERYAIFPLTITDNERITQIKSLRVIEQGPNATVVVTPGTQITLQPGPEVIIDATYDPAAKQALEEALTKWQAAGITEYEFTTRYMDEGTEQQWTLRVSGDNVTLVASTEGTDAPPDEYAIGLPEEQFATLQDAANNIENLTEDGKLVMTYAVRFDTNYGFPVRFEMRPEPGPAPDLGYIISVDDFRVIATK
jgi:hypothetical protein